MGGHAFGRLALSPIKSMNGGKLAKLTSKGEEEEGEEGEVGRPVVMERRFARPLNNRCNERLYKPWKEELHWKDVNRQVSGFIKRRWLDEEELLHLIQLPV